MVIVVLPLKILLPILASLVVPVLVVFTVPENVQPLKYKPGLTAVTLPPIKEEGPNCKDVAVLFNVRFTGTLPSCVNCFRMI